jgi:hypothetical protein
MPKPSQIKAFVLLGAIGATLIGTGVWFLGSPNPVELRADDARLRDAIDPSKPAAPVRPRKRPPMTPLAVVPWKRDDDVFVPVVLEPAEVPWHRDREQCVPVDLPLFELPWRQ